MKDMLLIDLLPKVISVFILTYNGKSSKMYTTSDWLKDNSLYKDKLVSYIVANNTYLEIGVEDNESI